MMIFWYELGQGALLFIISIKESFVLHKKIQGTV